MRGNLLKVWGMRQGHRHTQHRGLNNNNNSTLAVGGSFIVTMCASFLATNGGSSISEEEATGMSSSKGRRPLLSIRLEKGAEK